MYVCVSTNAGVLPLRCKRAKAAKPQEFDVQVTRFVKRCHKHTCPTIIRRQNKYQIVRFVSRKLRAIIRHVHVGQSLHLELSPFLLEQFCTPRCVFHKCLEIRSASPGWSQSVLQSTTNKEKRSFCNVNP